MTENNKPQLSFVLVKGLVGRKGKPAFITPKCQYLLTRECHHLSRHPVSTVAASRFTVVRIDHSQVCPCSHWQSKVKVFISRLCISTAPVYPETDLLLSNLCLIPFRVCFCFGALQHPVKMNAQLLCRALQLKHCGQ